ncbi:MAG: MFS transporter [Acidobacteria bacterium]|nr:MFS transporter [Acidobacteriota bacterium]
MLVLLAGITYLDRVCIAVTAPRMSADLGLSRMQMSLVFGAFTLAYAMFEIPTGLWGDRVGTRRVLTRIVVWWSAFTVATAGVFSYASLLATRFLFGAGEAGAWPNVARTLSRWFPQRERGTAQGVFFMGAHLAGGLTPLLVTALLTRLPWRALFVLFGSVGFLWALAWFLWFRNEPEEHAAVNGAERAYIAAGRGHAGAHTLERHAWRRLLANRSVLALCAMYFTQTYGFAFYVTWLPTYLQSARGFSATTLGVLAGLPLTLSVAADLLGGITTDRLTARFGLRLGRAAVGGASLACACLFLIAGTMLPDPLLGALFIALAAASSNFLLGASWGAAVDIGGEHAGMVSAAMNTSGQIGGFLCPIVVAWGVDHLGGWMGPLYLTGALYLLGSVCWIWVDPSRRES